MNTQIGIAIIGCGYWGVNYVRVFSELPDARLVAICDQQAERLSEVGRRFPEAELTTDLEAVLTMPGVDAVVIATTASTHYAIAERCLYAGKHLLIEKPITTTTADAEALIELADQQQRMLMVGHTFIYNPAVRKVKEYIDTNQVGHVYYLYAQRTNLGPIRRDVNALWDLAPHDISVFNHFLGATPEWVSAVGVRVLRNQREDVGFVSLGYPNDIVAHIHVSWADPNKVREMVVVGSERRIVFDDANPLERVRVFEKGVTTVHTEADSFGEFQLLMRDGDIISPRVEVSEPLKNLCRHFIECVNEGRRPLTSGLEGLEVVQVMEAINRSVQQQGTPVQVHTRQRLAMV